MIKRTSHALGEAMTVSSALKALAVLALLAAATPAWAADPASGIRAHVRDVHSIYQRDGMAGLEVASRACWAGEGGFPCLHMDVAAGTLDRNFVELLGIAGHPYFAVEPVLRRGRPVFAAAGWDMETSNAYLQFLDAAIQTVLRELDVQLGAWVAIHMLEETRCGGFDGESFAVVARLEFNRL